MSTTDAGRIERALSQRLFLVSRNGSSDFVIMGSTGTKSYDIHIGRYHTCTCMDYKMRHKICKHIIYTLVRILKVPENRLSRSFKLPLRELRTLLQNSVLPDIESVSIATATRQPITGECPICYDDMTPEEEIVYCRFSCGQNLHKVCWERYSTYNRNAKCVMCRAEF